MEWHIRFGRYPSMLLPKGQRTVTNWLRIRNKFPHARGHCNSWLSGGPAQVGFRFSWYGGHELEHCSRHGEEAKSITIHICTKRHFKSFEKSVQTRMRSNNWINLVRQTRCRIYYKIKAKNKSYLKNIKNQYVYVK